MLHIRKSIGSPEDREGAGGFATVALGRFAAAALLGVSLLVFVLVSPAGAGAWKGEEIQKDGALHVMNPAKGTEPSRTVKLEELWRIGGDTDDEDEFFGVISQILSDEQGNVYLLDTQLSQVKIFTADGEALRSIGREGEGPGEFRRPTGMFLMDNGDLGVMQLAPGKIVLLTPEGEPAGEHALPQSEDGGFLILLGCRSAGDHLVLAIAKNAFQEGRFDQSRYLASIDHEGKELARYHEEVRTIEFANAVLDDKQWDTFDRRWSTASDGRVYAATSYPDYRITVWNADGTINRIIEREYTHRKRSDREMELVENLMSIFARQIPNCTVNITDYTKDIETFYVREDGSIWVLTSDGSRDQPEGSLGVFDVFDPEGRFVRQVTLMGEGNPLMDGYYFVRDRLYVVTDLLQAAMAMQAGGEPVDLGEEEPEPMSVICYKINGDHLTSRN
jgi:hypothetical protein